MNLEECIILKVLCGLPILFRNSGSLPEYCKKYGVSFEGIEDITLSIKEIKKNYEKYKKNINLYDRTSDRMCLEYYNLFRKLYNNRNIYLTKRSLLKNPWLILRNQIPI